jgi:hypothetical protein
MPKIQNVSRATTALLGSRASSSSVPTYDELRCLAKQNNGLRKLIRELVDRCVWCVEQLKFCGHRHRCSCGSALVREFDRVRATFIEFVGSIRQRWMQIDSTHVFRWDPNLFGLFASRIAPFASAR